MPDPTIDEFKPYLKPDGTAWKKWEVFERMGNKRLGEMSGSKLEAKCPLHEFATKSGIVSYDTSPYKKFRFECFQCTRMRLGSQEALDKEFNKWLNKGLDIPDDLGVHFNPFELETSAPELAYLRDVEGNALLYSSGINIVYGKPGTFKSWLLLSLLEHHDVRYWDFENGAGALAGRLRTLGIPPERAQRFASPTGSKGVIERVEMYVEERAEIVCIDGFAGLAQVMGINAESNQDVMSVFAEVLNPLREAGVTVVLLDHLPQDGGSDDYPIGAQAKKAQADLTLLLRQEKRHDEIGVYVTKDRHGFVFDRAEPGSLPRRLGTLSLRPRGDKVALEISPIYSANRAGQQLSTEEANMEKAIWDYVEGHPNCSKADIERNVLGKTERKRKALENLEALGYVQSERIGTSFAYKVVKTLDLQWAPLS